MSHRLIDRLPETNPGPPETRHKSSSLNLSDELVSLRIGPCGRTTYNVNGIDSGMLSPQFDPGLGLVV